MDDATYLMLGASAAGAASAGGTGPVLGWLRRRRIYDVPNHRSSHTTPTPRGAGLAVVAVLLAGWAAAFASGSLGLPDAAMAVLVGGAVLYAVSWLDDLKDIPRLVRFPVHVAAVAVAVLALPDAVRLFPEAVPLWVERTSTALCWVWFLNLYNFMDGIDGITGVQTAGLGAGLVAVGLVTGAGVLLPLPLMGALAVGAAAGFLPFNWHPAKVFLGDVGAIPLGYLLGFALFGLAAEGHVAAALILPAFYLVDASVTLIRRLGQGRPPWAHRAHFYQRAVHDGGMTPAAVAGWVFGGDMLLIGAACLAERGAAAAGIALAAAVVGALLVRFSQRMGGQRENVPTSSASARIWGRACAASSATEGTLRKVRRSVSNAIRRKW